MRLDRSKIRPVGRPAIGKFLLALQTYKTLGDLEGGTALFERYSNVSADMSAARAIVMARKEPRQLLVQPHLKLCASGDDVEIQTFDATPQGMIESFVAHFPPEDAELTRLHEAEVADVSD